MDKHKKLRWTILLTALTGTIGAIFYPVDEPVAMWTPPPVPKTAPSIRKISAAVLQDQTRPIWIANDDDPFAPRVWEAAPPPSEPTRTIQQVELTPAASEPAPPPPPPPLPYRFLGQMQDGADRIFYLGHGEQVLLARQGEVLEGTYKVVAVNADMLEFESIQSGIRQTLPIPTQ
jgi:hypothetical protein